MMENVPRDFQTPGYRENYRRIFGEKKFKPIHGGEIWVDGVWVPKSEYKNPRIVHAPLCKVRDSGLDVEVHRAAKDPKNTGMRIEKGYRSIG